MIDLTKNYINSPQFWNNGDLCTQFGKNWENTENWHKNVQKRIIWKWINYGREIASKENLPLPPNWTKIWPHIPCLLVFRYQYLVFLLPFHRKYSLFCYMYIKLIYWCFDLNIKNLDCTINAVHINWKCSLKLQHHEFLKFEDQIYLDNVIRLNRLSGY